MYIIYILNSLKIYIINKFNLFKIYINKKIINIIKEDIKSN